MKLITILLSLSLFFCTHAALNVKQEGIVKKYSNKIPYIKNTVGFEKATSIQKEYFEFNDAEFFNKSVLSYYKKNVESFSGFTSQGELVYIIPELNSILNEFKDTKNTVSKHRLKNKYKDTFYKLASKEYTELTKKKYYSEINLIGSYKYNLKDNTKKILLDRLSSKEPSLYFSCYENGDVIATFIGRQTGEKIKAPSNVSNTTVVLIVSEELKSYFSYTEEKIKGKLEKNICVFNKKFANIEEGELYENTLTEYGRAFIGLFTIDKNTDKPYLTGKMSHIGLFKIDQSDFYHYPYELLGGHTFSDEKIEDIIERGVDSVSKDKNYTKQFLNSKFSYNLSEFFIHGLPNNQMGLTKNGTRLYVVYDYKELDNEIVLTLNKIKRDAPHRFPLKIRIIKNPEKSSYDLEAYVIHSDNPYTYIKEELNLKSGFNIDWENEVINKK